MGSGFLAMKSQALAAEDVRAYVDSIIGENDHAGRVLSISNAVMGVIHGAALAVHAIGAALARVDNLVSKHATKQVDRLLSNPGFDLEQRSYDWVKHVVGDQKDLVVALDWTDYDADKQATVTLAMVTKRGRSRPLMWRTVNKSELLGQQNRIEDELLVRFHERVPEGVRVTVTADRGFGDQKLFAFLETLGFDYVIRLSRKTTITSERMESRAAFRWLKPLGRLFRLTNVTVTHSHTPVAAFVSVKKAKMKEAWFLVSSRTDWTGTQIVKAYSRRFTIEEMFRDEKDWRYGMGLSHTRVSQPMRRDRLLFLGALARDLLTLLGAAGESLGLDRELKVNTVAKRTHSLYRQGCHYYGSLPNMHAERFRALMKRFGDLIFDSPLFVATLGLNPI